VVELALLVARLLLSAVFFLAGVAKLADRKGATKALNEFGVPPAFAKPLSLLVSVAEIAVAAALVPVASAWYGACAALALLGAFSIGIAVNLARGRNPDCHCFGQLHSSPIGRSTLIRNSIVAGVAGWLVVRGKMRDGPSLWSHLASAGDNERRLFVVAACLMCFLLLRALRRRDSTESDDVAGEPFISEQPALRETNVQYVDSALRKVLQEGMGWPIGTQAPEFALPDITGQKWSLQSLVGRGQTLWPSLGRWAREYEHALNMIIISRGSTTEDFAKQNNIEVSRVLLQNEFELSDAYGVTATPAAVLVGADGSIQSRLAVGREDINQLISSSAKLPADPISPIQNANAQGSESFR